MSEGIFAGGCHGNNEIHMCIVSSSCALYRGFGK